jgi:hypothetical protein
LAALHGQRLPASTMAQLEFRDRAVDRATRRYLAVLKTLATVRRLAVPTVQVNVARNQVNVAGASAFAGGPGGDHDRAGLPEAGQARGL